eukprot:scaffold5612_cov150-Amphora_coffeaeformis.AAC.6
MRVSTLCLVLGLSAKPWSVFAAPSPPAVTPYEPLLLNLKDLSNNSSDNGKSDKDDALLKALATTGMFAISREEDTDATTTAGLALEGWCRCVAESTSHNMDNNPSPFTQVMALEDGVTQRTTLASATVGTELLALKDDMCGPTVTALLEDLRDDMAQVSQVVVQALDRLFFSQTRPLLYDTHGKSYSTVSSMVADATHLEHFHLYEKNHQAQAKGSNEKTLAFHTDAGLFLMFVPGYDCQHHQPEATAPHSFWIRDVDGTERPVQFDTPNTRAVVMMGAGAEQWLMQQHQQQTVPPPLRATTHAVQLQAGQTRAWYGKMHLVPDYAIVQTVPTTKTFRDLKESVMTTSIELATGRQDKRTLQRLSSPSLGCGDVVHTNDDEKFPLSPHQHEASSTTTTHRRRLQHVGSPSDCNNSTNFFCWYQCLDIPSADQAQGYLNEGYSLYCLDPAVLASSGNKVSSATEPCEQGYTHNGACQGSWQPTAPGVPLTVSFDHLQDPTAATLEEYCYGGVSMYMDGFHWVHDSLCVIYLFPKWVLDSRVKLAMASLGTLFMGVLLEAVIWQRRKVAKRMSAGMARLGVGSVFYGLQLTFGYFIMLVVMTYSGVLFLCCVGGLVLGNMLFNGSDGLIGAANKKGKAGGAAREDPNEDLPNPCICVDDKTDGEAGGSGAEYSCCNTGSQEEDIPDGATPCCQYSSA